MPAGNGIDIYRSADAGLTWTFVTTAVSDTGRGNPPSLVKLRDGRLAVTYGYRAEPYSIRARISRDGGETWDAERILRADAADWDLGYPRSVQRPDGKIVTVCYYNDRSAVERYIAATIWIQDCDRPARLRTGFKTYRGFRLRLRAKRFGETLVAWRRRSGGSYCRARHFRLKPEATKAVLKPVQHSCGSGSGFSSRSPACPPCLAAPSPSAEAATTGAAPSVSAAPVDLRAAAIVIPDARLTPL